MLKRIAKSISNNNLHVQLTPMRDATKSMRCKQDPGLGARRVPENEVNSQEWDSSVSCNDHRYEFPSNVEPHLVCIPILCIPVAEGHPETSGIAIANSQESPDS